MSDLVEVRNLVKYFDIGRHDRVHAVDDVSLTIAEQEIVGLVGESGSGKSTLGKTLVGLHAKTSGQVTFDGEVLPSRYTPQDFQKFAPRMQMIFQDPYSSLNPRMTVGEIVGEGLKLHSRQSSTQIREPAANANASASRVHSSWSLTSSYATSLSLHWMYRYKRKS
jgi:ABC-type oligopeptide transport system ATPase subunit